MPACSDSHSQQTVPICSDSHSQQTTPKGRLSILLTSNIDLIVLIGVASLWYVITVLACWAIWFIANIFISWHIWCQWLLYLGWHTHCEQTMLAVLEEYLVVMLCIDVYGPPKCPPPICPSLLPMLNTVPLYHILQFTNSLTYFCSTVQPWKYYSLSNHISTFVGLSYSPSSDSHLVLTLPGG